MVGGVDPRGSHAFALGGLVALTTLGLALRVVALDRESFWLDEAGRAAIAALPPLAIPQGVRAVELSPPLYHFLLAAWTRLVGGDDVAVRLLSALLSAAAIPLTYALAHALAGRRAALLTAALAAVAPFYVTYGREAAMYALFLALALLSTLAYVRLLRAGPTRMAVVGYLAATLAMLYTHYYALFVVAAQNVGVLWRAARSRGLVHCGPAAASPTIRGAHEGATALQAAPALPPGLSAAWWGMQWALALGLAPWVPVLWQQGRLAAAVEDWAAPNPLEALGGLVVALSVGPATDWPALLAIVCFLPALWVGARPLSRDPMARLLLACYTLVPLALGLLAAYPLHAFRERGYIALAFVPQLVVAVGLLRLATAPPKAPVALARGLPVLAALYGAALVGLLLYGSLAALADPKEDWRGAASRIALLARDDDVVYLLHYAGALPLDRYLTRPLERRGLPADFTWQRGYAARYWLEPADLDGPLAADRAAGRRIWAVLSHADGRGDSQLLAYLDGHYRRVLREDFYGIRLGLWEPPGE